MWMKELKILCRQAEKSKLKSVLKDPTIERKLQDAESVSSISVNGPYGSTRDWAGKYSRQMLWRWAVNNIYTRPRVYVLQLIKPGWPGGPGIRQDTFIWQLIDRKLEGDMEQMSSVHVTEFIEKIHPVKKSIWWGSEYTCKESQKWWNRNFCHQILQGPTLRKLHHVTCEKLWLSIITVPFCSAFPFLTYFICCWSFSCFHVSSQAFSKFPQWREEWWLYTGWGAVCSLPWATKGNSMAR